MIYDELVKRLRIAALLADKGLVISPSVCLEAADAIEELIPFKNQVEKGMGLLDKADELLKAVKPRWIPVTERLPEHGWYLAYGPSIKMEVLHFHSVDEVWSSERYYDIEVTHWMPLPDPPKEKT